MFINYLYNFEHAIESCDIFEQNVEFVFFNKGTLTVCPTFGYCQSDTYREYFNPIKSCIQLYKIVGLQSLASSENLLYETALSLESPEKMRNLTDFKICVRTIRLGFMIAHDEMQAFSLSFDDEERQRINEAIHDYIEKCNYSCIAMSASTVESRLLKLMCLASSNSKSELEKMTLGKLISEYFDNKDKYKSVIPQKHEHLLRLLNEYRIFSVHPKRENITRRITISIFNLTIEFLLDQNTKPEVVKVKLIAD